MKQDPWKLTTNGNASCLRVHSRRSRSDCIHFTEDATCIDALCQHLRLYMCDSLAEVVHSKKDRASHILTYQNYQNADKTIEKYVFIFVSIETSSSNSNNSSNDNSNSNSNSNDNNDNNNNNNNNNTNNQNRDMRRFFLSICAFDKKTSFFGASGKKKT